MIDESLGEDTKATCAIDFSAALPNNDKKKENNAAISEEKRILAMRQAQALVAWVETFHLSSFRRKASKRTVKVTNPEPGKLFLEGVDAQAWEKSIRSAVKKVICEDLGNMDAEVLLPTIPEIDQEGRGMKDVIAMEKKFTVKVVFDNETGHVFLVGDSKKLEKKCFALRNMLSHYHWRLSGRDVSFSN